MTFEEAKTASLVDRRYAIKREIARGGMGVVFEAEHTTLRSPVALKTLTSTALASSAVHARLMREARALSVVRHPGVTNVLDAGVCRTFGPYVALEMIEGRSLDGLVVARQRLDVESVVSIALQLAQALGAAHARGVIHRDVKPGNVLVTRDASGGGDRVKLIDFGIACVRGEDDVVTRRLTQAGEVLGTIEYIAPEQLLDPAPPTVRADVYSLGALAYECLMGDVPFQGPPRTILTTLLAGGRPSSIRERRPDVPAAVDAAVMRALSRDPSARFASAQAFEEALLAAWGRAPRPLSLLEAPRSSEGRAEGSSRRQFVRAPYVTPVRVVSSNGAWDGRTEDVSEGGLLVVMPSHAEKGETPESSAQGQRVSVRLPLPASGRVVTVEATACWTRAQRGQRAMGISFTSLAEEVRDDIQKYVALMSRDVVAEPGASPRAA